MPDGRQPPSSRATIYDVFRQPTDRRLRRLPRLVTDAVRLVWAASPRLLALLVALEVLNGVGVAAQLLVGRRVVEAVLDAERVDLGMAHVLPSLVVLLAISALLAFAGAARVEIQRLLGEAAARHAVARIIDVAADVDLEAYDRPEFHDRLRRAEIAAAGRPFALVSGVTGLLGAAVTVIGLVAAMAALAPVLVPLVVLAYGPLWVVNGLNSRTLYRFNWRMTPSDRLRLYLAGLLTSKDSAQELRVFALAPHLRRRYDQLYDQRMATLGQLTSARLRRSLWASLAGSVVMAVSFGALVAMVLSGRLSTAAAVPAAVGIQQLGARLATMATSTGLIYENGLFLEDYQSFLDLAPSVAATRPDRPAPEAFAELTVDRVSFRYPDTPHPALEDVSFSLRAGEVVALVGENGSGKTTLAKLLCHLYTPTEGRILWDGADTAAFDPAGLRRHTTVIFQDFVHYHLTAGENVGLADCTRIDDRQGIAAAAVSAGADEVLAALPEGYDTPLGRQFEGGEELSVGQWQRIALARALFRAAPLLILDEPTAALDARAESELFERMREVARGRTVVLISHRFSSVRSADRILVLHHGHLVEDGTHDQLMARGGHYAGLFSLQAAAYGSTS